MSHHTSALYRQQRIQGRNAGTVRRSTAQAAIRRNRNTVAFTKPGSTKLGPITHTLLLAAILCVFGLLYLTQITKTSTFGYEVSELNTYKEQLIEENQGLEVEAARLQALERIRTSDVASQLQDSSPSAVQFTN